MIAFNGTIKALLTKTVTFPSQGSIQAIGIGVYSDPSCNDAVSLIDWGTPEPGDMVVRTLYMRNEGNIAVTLSLDTDYWSPPNLFNYISLDWNYAGGTIDPNQVIEVTLTLSVSPSIEGTGITTFGFDIVITGSG